MVRKDVGGGMRLGGSRAPALPLMTGKLCPQAHCPAHLQTLSSDQEKCCHFTHCPRAWHGGSQQEVLNKSFWVKEWMDDGPGDGEVW